MENTKKPYIAITAGDPNGVGYEVIIKAIADPHIAEICTPVVYGNWEVAKQHMRTLDEEYRNVKLNIVKCYDDNLPIKFGVSTKEAGAASLSSLEHAVADIKAGKIQALVTAPINKENIQSDKFRFSGHTEFLTHHFGNGQDSLMMMVSDMMRVALVTNHTPIAKVASMITEERILRKLTLLNKTLQNDFSIRRPRIAVLALNPHAGDNGLLGTEEQTIIKPAIDKAMEQGIMAFGPYSADGFFGSGKYTHFDAVLGMYHDQGLIPFKSLDMNGVNYTAGLDIIRTSPDHGTAYDLAGKNQADSTSFSHALYMALDLLKTRENTREINANPLPKRERIDNNNRGNRFAENIMEDSSNENINENTNENTNENDKEN